MKKLLLILFTSLIIPNIVFAQSMEERRAITLKREKDLRSFKIYLKLIGQDAAISPITGKREVVQKYNGIFETMDGKMNMVVSYMPVGDVVEAYLVSMSSAGPQYIREIYSSEGVHFKEEDIKNRILYLLRNKK